MSMKPACYALVCTALALTGCASISAKPAHPLARQTWELREIRTSSSRPVILTDEQSRNHTLKFGRDNALVLKLDCNNGTADWTAGDAIEGKGILTIGPVAATRALCPPPSYGEQLAADLPQASAFMLSDEGRKLSIVTRHVLFRFGKAD